jgi:hypothetical protein
MNATVEEVRACLAAEPEATSHFFFDYNFEPVLCCAIRLGCGAEVVVELLRHGADAHACETMGYSPLTLLASMPSAAKNEEAWDLTWMWFAPSLFMADVDVKYDAMGLKVMRERLQVAGALIEAGVDPKAVDGSHRSPIVVARTAGNLELARFLEHYHDVQTARMLRRSHIFAIDVLQVLLAYLLPESIKEQL